VRNIVEANEKEEISNWCDFGMSYCQHKFTVRPFHCLGERILRVCLSVCLLAGKLVYTLQKIVSSVRKSCTFCICLRVL